jgi:hypothetical protein
MMDIIEILLLNNLILILVGAYTMYKYGEKRYESAVLDTILLHHEGRLTYKAYMESGVEMLDIQIAPMED